MSKVYLVMIGNYEGDMVLTPAYSRLADAMGRWNEEKNRLKKEWNEYIEKKVSSLMDTAKEQIKKLDDNTDPFDTFCCLPHDTPFVKEIEVI
jgi:hypothetical protein